nr:MAG TPA: hypothetical protein [Caudoviricetes sp.]
MRTVNRIMFFLTHTYFIYDLSRIIGGLRREV